MPSDNKIENYKIEYNMERIQKSFCPLLKAWGQALEEEQYEDANRRLKDIYNQNKEHPLDMSQALAFAEYWQKECMDGASEDEVITLKERLERVQYLKEDLGYKNIDLELDLD